MTPHALTAMRDRLVEQLEAAKYPVADVDVVDIGDGLSEIVATLVAGPGTRLIGSGGSGDQTGGSGIRWIRQPYN